MRKAKLFCLMTTFLFLAGVMVSCNNNPEGKRCYELTATIYEWGGIQHHFTTQYVWGTKAEMEEAKQEIMNQLNAMDVIFDVKVQPTNSTKSDCH